MQVTVAPFNGFEIVSRTERTEVIARCRRRRARRCSRSGCGPCVPAAGSSGRRARSRAGTRSRPRPWSSTCRPTAAATASTLNPRLRRLLERARASRSGRGRGGPGRLGRLGQGGRAGRRGDGRVVPPRPAPPAASPADAAAAGHRRASGPIPRPTPAGIAATRNVGGRWYDLFVAHQVVFPLVAGHGDDPAVPRSSTARPVALQFFSQEERYALTEPRRDAASCARCRRRDGRPTSPARWPRGSRSTGGSRRRRPGWGRGSPSSSRLAGEGNTALWPAPEVQWPAGSRAYSDRVEERLSTTEGRIGGTKIFRYLVVPDSAGALRLPAASYAYYDLATSQYAERHAAGRLGSRRAGIRSGRVRGVAARADRWTGAGTRSSARWPPADLVLGARSSCCRPCCSPLRGRIPFAAHRSASGDARPTSVAPSRSSTRCSAPGA